MYGEYTATTDEWTLVTYEFTLAETTTVNFVVMNPSGKVVAASDKLIDDFSVTTKDGGIASAMRRYFKK